ncbi:hypothetical protein Y032_0011g1533 [Ancylostoma ceylanicum]|uniref:Telomerase reverse transcriptase n=1 Tax=Ancylostoma ceylanicum TaxID=53326 RepID=A0A016VEM8_9BILA|nr:hypothetical protein Y032_0011g1533 [Ancylostoma ceylanicum]
MFVVLWSICEPIVSQILQNVTRNRFLLAFFAEAEESGPPPLPIFRNGAANEQQLRTFLEETVSVLPRGFLGVKNTRDILDAIFHALTTWSPNKALCIPMFCLNILECDACRALRSRRTMISQPVSELQRHLVVNIARFLTKFILANLLDFAFIYSATNKSHYQFYDRKGFKFWRGIEKRKFIRDYDVKIAAPYSEISSKFIVGSTPCRTIVQNVSQLTSAHKNELRVLAACLDGHVKAAGLKPVGALTFEIRRLKRFLKGYALRCQLIRKPGSKAPSKRLYFAKADISNCFAAIDRKILKNALRKLVKDRVMTAVYGYGKTDDFKRVRIDRAAPTYETAVESMLQAMKRKCLREFTKVPVKVQEVKGSEVVEAIMNLLAGIRLSLDSSGRLYTMGKGVPQGFELSCRLAHIYLLFFEHMSWKRLSTLTCLLRYVDDYLICSYSRMEVRKILETLQKPNVFGISARASKCQASFRIPNVQRAGRYLKWCGWLIDTKRYKVFQQRSDAQLIRATRCFSKMEYARRRILLRQWDGNSS